MNAGAKHKNSKRTQAWKLVVKNPESRLSESDDFYLDQLRLEKNWSDVLCHYYQSDAFQQADVKVTALGRHLLTTQWYLVWYISFP